MDWDHEQLLNASIIIHEGERLGASPQDIQIALMTAITESGLRNVHYGDLDSLGLFQQRTPWGTVAQRQNPAEAARMFFEGGHGGQPGLFDYPDRASMSLGEAAQKVQVSAYPDRYAEHTVEAQLLLANEANLPQEPGSSILAGTGSDGETTPGLDDYDPDPGAPVTHTNQDGDGLTDEFELLLGTDPTKVDTDHDRLSDDVETYQTHTDPLVANDPDVVEDLLAHPGSTAPHQARIPLAALQAGFGGGATLDHDRDGLSDLTEAQLASNPYDSDSDDDGVSDGIEHRLGSNLQDIDTDNDGLTDDIEYSSGSIETGN